MMGERIGRAEGWCNGGACGNAARCEPGEQIFGKLSLAAKEMGASRNIEPQSEAVRGRGGWAIMLGPGGQGRQRLLAGFRFGTGNAEFRINSERIGQRLMEIKPSPDGRLVESCYSADRAVLFNKSERLSWLRERGLFQTGKAHREVR